MSTPKTYEEERDEAAAKIADDYNDYGPLKQCATDGADWANDRAAKELANVTADRQTYVCSLGKCSEELESAHAMIETLGNALTRLNTLDDDSVSCPHFDGRHSIPCAALAKLEEWRKTNES